MMFEKLAGKGALMRLVTVLLIASVAILALNILTDSKDTRRKIIDRDGSSEEQLCSVLSGMKGVGAVDAIIEYDENNKVTGVILTAEGGANPVVANDLTKGVATLYRIPVSSVIVFEKEQEG